MDLELTNRQIQLLKHIVNEYIATAIPVGSKIIAAKYLSNVSAATIRNEMAVLEKKGYLEKNHTSSGRIPSVKCYKFYEKNFSHVYIDIDNIKLKLKKIFNNRNNTINEIVEESCKIISESLKLPLVTIEKEQNLLLKRIDLVKINTKKALIIVILSNGSLVKNMIYFDKAVHLQDISICIRIFNDRLLDCPLNDIQKRLVVIKEIIKKKVQEYEFILQEVIERIFEFKRKIIKNVHNQKAILSVPEFRDEAKLKEILEILESTSIWEQIAYHQQKSGGKTCIIFGDEINKDDLVFAKTNIKLSNYSQTEFYMVAPTRVDYSKVKWLLKFINDEFQKDWK